MTRRESRALVRGLLLAAVTFGVWTAFPSPALAVDPDCNTDDTSGCVPGSVLELDEQKFNCTESLEDIAAENGVGSEPGVLPLLVRITHDEPTDYTPAPIDLRNGCTGLEGNTPVTRSDDCETDSATCYSGEGYEPGDVDLILDVQGDGLTYGTVTDAIKVRLTASDIVVTGHVDCGPKGPGADGIYNTGDDSHQDGLQVQGGERITVVDFEWGDWATDTSTCGGGCGAFCVGLNNNNPVEDVVCIRCKAVTCNWGMSVSRDSGETLAILRSGIIDSSFRTGDDQWKNVDMPATAQDNGLGDGQCKFDTAPCVFDEAEEDSVDIGNFCDAWPYEADPGCNTEDTSECEPNAVLELDEQKFTCTEPLADIAADEGGQLPLLVRITFDDPVLLEPAVVDLQSGCEGEAYNNKPVALSDDCETEPETCYGGEGYEPGDVDLILEIEGDGVTYGGRASAVKARLSARDIVVTGQVNCGPRGAGADDVYARTTGGNDDVAQDAVFVQGGKRLTFVDVEVGDWETETSTCEGRGGSFDFDQVNPSWDVEDVVCVRCRAVSCNRGLAVGETLRSGAIESFFRTGDDQWKEVDLPATAQDNGVDAGQCYTDSPAGVIDGAAVDPIDVDNFYDRWPYSSEGD